MRKIIPRRRSVTIFPGNLGHHKRKRTLPLDEKTKTKNFQQIRLAEFGEEAAYNKAMKYLRIVQYNLQ